VSGAAPERHRNTCQVTVEKGNGAMFALMKGWRS
jgi:hypothetical protein